MAQIRSLLSCLSLAGLGFGARFTRKGSTGKFIAGFPVHQRSPADPRTAGTAEQWTVVLDGSTSNADLDELCHGKCSAVGHPSEGGVPFVNFAGSEAELTQLLQGRSGVQFVEPEFMERALPEDETPGDTATASWGLKRIGVPNRKARGEGVHIYVVDSGVMTTHRDFGGRAIATLDTSAGRQTECNGDTSCAADRNGHGTHCAGTAGGSTYGVADRATIHAVKAISDNGSGYQSWVVMSFDWIAAKGKRPAVASASVQYNGESWSMETSVRAATRAGVTVVVAAGNVNSWACDFSPAFAREAITVSATTPADAKAQFSNFGSCSNIWAPGQDITSAMIGSNTASETWSGTSMACPHVSGAAALILEKNPSFNRDQVLARLVADGEKGTISGVKFGDPKAFLQVDK